MAAPTALAAAIVIGIGSAILAYANSGADSDWKDPYPLMPIRNDPAFVGRAWHPGPSVGGNLLEYFAAVPQGDTTAKPVIVVAGGGEHSPAEKLFGKAIVVFIGPSSTNIDSGPAHNAWLLDKLSHGSGPECSPVCPAWMFVPATGIREILADFAAHVRFAHERVQMFANTYTRFDIYRALDPILQPYFAGVAHAIYAEWRQATCPVAAKPTALAPRIFFSWGGCDASFCPTVDCMKTLRSNGYTIDPSSRGDANMASCRCPEGARSHLLPAAAATRKATYDWLLTNVRR
ncbi:MAG: hypothetical protein JO056_01675 [Alphaproteobacteria bacterium]|nr:hypothetical protein [Alphaproteobacteria bacterium]